MSSTLRQEPLCGWEWYNANKGKVTKEQIESLGIQLTCDGAQVPVVKKHKVVRELMGVFTEGGIS